MRVLLVIYDNDSYIHYFPIGMAYIAAALKQAGHDVVIYSQDVHHYPEEHLTRFLDNEPFDIIGVSVIAGYYQYQKLLKISAAIHASKRRPKHYILGGHGPCPEPDYFLNKTGADIVVLGEGEQTVVELLPALSGGRPLKDVLGIAFRDNGRTIINERRPLIKDIDEIPWPAYDMFLMEYYRLLKQPRADNTDFSMPMLSARGCPFKCNFCYRMDDDYRMRSPEKIMAEIRFLNDKYRINYIDFADELLMSSGGRVEAICDAIQASGLKFKWCCNGRLNYGRPEVLELMKAAGCVYINYGIESFDDQILRNMNKTLTTRQIVEGIEATLNCGISPGFNIIFGNIGETSATLQRGVEFLLKYDDGSELRTIRPVTPYPGSPLYYYAIEHGLLKGVEDFYEHKHINSDLLAVNFTNLSDEEFHTNLMAANTVLIRNYYKKKLAAMELATRNLYLKRDASFRGYRQT